MDDHTLFTVIGQYQDNHCIVCGERSDGIKLIHNNHLKYICYEDLKIKKKLITKTIYINNNVIETYF